MSVHIRNLNFSYGDKKVLHEIDLSVETGERIGIVGVSGGGKSTLLKLISGLYAAEVGSVNVRGATIPAEIRTHVAMVMQNALLFPASIRENITCGHPMADEVIRRACDAAQLSGWIATLPEGIDAFVGERGGKVSGGQAQRIAIARAIAKNAPVILLDEATSALDAETSGAALSALMHLTQGRTVISVSHRPEALSGMERVYRLEEGRLFDA